MQGLPIQTIHSEKSKFTKKFKNSGKNFSLGIPEVF
jgi:hypothetical protein